MAGITVRRVRLCLGQAQRRAPRRLRPGQMIEDLCFDMARPGTVAFHYMNGSLDKQRSGSDVGGARSLLSSKPLIIAIVALATVAAAIITAAWINLKALEAGRLVTRSLEVRERSERVLGALRDAETGQRGYLLTGRPEFLQPYETGLGSIEDEFTALASVAAGNVEQEQRIAHLRRLASAKIATLQSAIALYRDGRRDQAIDDVSHGAGKGLMDEIRRTVTSIQQEEARRMVARTANENQRRLLSTLGIILALAVLAFAAAQQLYAAIQANRSLAEANAALDQRVSERTRELENEKLRVEALLHDVNHRVGNNLAMISALLNVQARKSSEPAVKQALSQAQSRIQAIAAAQRRFRIDTRTDEIDVRPYFEDLLAEHAQAIEGRPIRLDLVMGDVRLPGRDAVSYVVLVNELVINAIKHAFPSGGGTVTVSADEGQDEAEALRLVVEDNGVGEPPDVEPGGLGRTVIDSLLRSMGGRMVVEQPHPGTSRPGTRVVLIFTRRTALADGETSPIPSPASDASEA
jgi:two-component sensor histidine kinase